MADFTEKLTNAEAIKFIDQVNEPFKNLPHLPSGIIEFFVTIVPWLALLGGVLGLLMGVVGALVTGTATLFLLSPIFMILVLGSILVALVQSVLLLLAFTPLKDKESRGWVLLFWANMVAVVGMLFRAMDGVSGLVGSVIGLLIGLYILFEMRPSYGVFSAATKKVKDEVKKLS